MDQIELEQQTDQQPLQQTLQQSLQQPLQQPLQYQPQYPDQQTNQQPDYQTNQCDKTDEFQEIKIFLDQASKSIGDAQNINSLENKTVVFLLGYTRAGKSTLFHLLQGDKLIKYGKKKLTIADKTKNLLIGNDGISFTKIMNIFFNKESEIIIIDTPGLYDTTDGYDEVISQINLVKMLNRCYLDKCRDVLFLAVSKYDESNYNELQETITRIKENFAEQMLPNYLRKFCLIISRSDSEDDEMNESMEIIFNRIIQSNNTLKQNPILNHLQTHKDQILYFPEVANEQQQEQIVKQIYNFIQNAQMENMPKLQQDTLPFVMTISDKGFVKLRGFLEKFENFYNKEISEGYDLLVQQINLIDNIEKRFKVCKYFQNIQENPLYFSNIQRFIYQFNKAHEHFNFQTISLKKIIIADQLFKQGWMEAIFQFESQKRYFNRDMFLQMNPNYDKVIHLSIKIGGELEKIYKEKNQANQVLFEQMMEITQKIQNLNSMEWDKLVAVIGNRQSGKSTAIDVIYNKLPENCNIYQPTVLEELEQFNPYLITYQKINKDIVIEFQEFSTTSLLFMQYLYQNSISQKKQFQLYLILDYKSNKDQIVSTALQNFIELNNFEKNLKLFIIANIKAGQTCPENLIEYLPESFKKFQIVGKSKIYKIYLSHNQFVLDDKSFFETSTFDIHTSQRQIKFPQEESIQSFRHFMKEIFYKLQQNIDINQRKMQEKIYQIPQFQYLIELSQLQPNSNNFTKKVKEQVQNFNVRIKNFENRYDQLQELHKELINQNKLVNLIENSLDKVKKAKNFLEALCYQIITGDSLNLRLDIQVIKNINNFFPFYLENDSDIIQKINFLETTTIKIYPEVHVQKNESRLTRQQIVKILENLKQLNNPQLDILSLLWQLLRQIVSDYKKILQLLKLMQASQSKNFRYTNSSFFVRIYFSFWSLFQRNQFAGIQQELQYVLSKHEDIKVYDSID